MQPEGHQTNSIWLDTIEIAPHPALQEDIETDVCIIGAGIAGLSTAYALAREGRVVVVLDDGAIGSGESGRTTAHLSNVIDDTYAEMHRLHGERGAQLAYQSHSEAIDSIEANVREENIDCDFLRLDGYLFVPPGESPDELDEELQAAHDAGFSSAEKIAQAPIPGAQIGPCLRFPNQGQFHALKYLQGLARAIEARGGRICSGTRVHEIEARTPDQMDIVWVRSERGPVVTANAVVVATNSPFIDRTVIHTKQHPYRTYVSALRVPRGAVETALYWDTLDPYHYVRLQPYDENSDALIVGGEDHKTGHEDDGAQRHRRLEVWAKHLFPMAGDVLYRWSGQVLEPVDGLAHIGRNPGDAPNVYICTGDSGMGMTHGALAGLLLCDLIQGRANEWETLYDPSRKTLKSGGEFLRESGDMAVQYKDWLTGGDVKSAEEIPAGEGAILRRGLSKIATYRDENGTLHQCSAVCPHLGCIVAWNSEEKSWDCPCHGSRFDSQGQLLNGPAATDLEVVDEAAHQ